MNATLVKRVLLLLLGTLISGGQFSSLSPLTGTPHSIQGARRFDLHRGLQEVCHIPVNADIESC
jgi:hypothetical protein